jgi:hypothetical protein
LFLVNEGMTSLAKAGGKMLKALRRYEAAMKSKFDPDTPLRILLSRLKDCEERFKAQAAATKAARHKK